MKIIFFNHTSYKSGAQKSLKYLIEEIKEISDDKLELWMVRRGPGTENLKDLDIPMIFTKGIVPFHGSTVSGMSAKLFIRNIIGFIPSVLISFIKLKKAKPDVLHLNSTSMFPVAIGAKLAKVPTVVTHIREPLLENKFGDILKFFNNRFNDKFIAISEYDLKSTKYKNIPSKVVYNFVNFNKNKKELSINESNNSLKMLYLGRIVSQNGILEMIKEFQEINTDKVYLTIAGFYENKSDYEKKVLEEVSTMANINIIDYVEEVETLIEKHDVILCPFIEPHFSRSIMEGAFLKRPTISRNIPSPNEIIIHNYNGWLYDNQSDLNNIVASLIKDKFKISVCGDNALEKAKIIFDSRRNAKISFDFIRSKD